MHTAPPMPPRIAERTEMTRRMIHSNLEAFILRLQAGRRGWPVPTVAKVKNLDERCKCGGTADARRQRGILTFAGWFGRPAWPFDGPVRVAVRWARPRGRGTRGRGTRLGSARGRGGGPPGRRRKGGKRPLCGCRRMLKVTLS